MHAHTIYTKQHLILASLILEIKCSEFCEYSEPYLQKQGTEIHYGKVATI